MLTLAPDSVPLYGHLAVAYSLIGQDEKAVELSERAITIDPSYGQVYFNLGIAYYNLKRYQDAIDAFQTAIRLSSRNTDIADAYTALAEVYAAIGDLDRAVELFKQAITINPSQSKACFDSWKSLFQAQPLSGCRKMPQKAVRLSPKYADAYTALAFAYSALGRFDEEINICNKAIELVASFSRRVYSSWQRLRQP